MEKTLNYATIVAKNLNQLRQEKKLTKRDLSKKLKLPYTTYNNYETGRSEPNIENLIKISNEFDITTDFLIGREFSNDFGYLTDQERAMVKSFRELTDLNKIKVASYTMGVLATQEN